MNHGTRKTTVSKLKKETLYAQIIITKAATGHRGINFLNDYMKLMKKSNDDSLTISKWNYEKKQILTVSNITTTVAPLTHRWQCQGKTNYHLHFWILNLKEFFMNPALMGSQEWKMMNSHWTDRQVSLIFGCSKRFSDFKTAVWF